MLTHRFRQLTASLLCITSLCAPASAAFAQEDASAQEALELYVGDIFEILPVHPLTDATYTWILTQDRNFIEAGRAQTFRKRLITPGRYTLYAEISSADQSQHYTRTFVLDFKPRTPGQPVLPPVSSGSTVSTSLVRTVPAQDSNMRVVVPMQSQLVKLEPLNPDVRPVVADLDLSRDTDGDSNPSNDIDTELTFFQTDATPLYVWITEPLTTRTLSVTAAMPDGALVQTIEVTGEMYAQEQGLIQSPVDVEVKQGKGRSFSFNAAFEIPNAPQTPLLYHWEFGDGQQSLLATPVHEYAADGTYEVKLRIRNLTDGKDVATFTQEVEVEEKMDGEVITTDPEPTDDPEQPTETPSTSSGMSLGSILLMAGIFIASILFGLLVIFVLSKLRRKGTSISDTIEAMEQSIVKTDTSKTPTLSIAPAPSVTKQTSTPPAEIAKREEDRESATPAVVLKEDAKAPSWLKTSANNETPAPAAPKPQPPVAAPVVTPAPKPQPTPATTPQAKPVSTPPWLQTPAAPAATPAPQKPAAPAPATAPAIPQQPKPVTPPAPQQPSKPAGTPPWLQTPPKPVAPAAAPQQPKPAPVVPTPTPAPAAPIQPKPVTPPVPQAAPVVQTPKPVTPPVVQPAVNQVTPPAPKPAAPVAPATPAPAVTPPAPKPFVPATPAPTPTPTPAVPVQPKPITPPQQVTPAPQAPSPVVAAPVQSVPTPAPVIAPKPVTPPAAPAPAAPIDQNDEPIAIIRADSLGTAQPVQPRPDTPTPPAAA